MVADSHLSIIIDSRATYAQEALQAYVESGQLPGAISVLYKDGVQETCFTSVSHKYACFCGRKVDLNRLGHKIS